MASHVSRTGGNGELSHEKMMRPPSAAVLGDGELLSGTPGREEIRALACAWGCPGQQGPSPQDQGGVRGPKGTQAAWQGLAKGAVGRCPLSHQGPG